MRQVQERRRRCGRRADQPGEGTPEAAESTFGPRCPEALDLVAAIDELLAAG